MCVYVCLQRSKSVLYFINVPSSYRIELCGVCRYILVGGLSYVQIYISLPLDNKWTWTTRMKLWIYMYKYIYLEKINDKLWLM